MNMGHKYFITQRDDCFYHVPGTKLILYDAPQNEKEVEFLTILFLLLFSLLMLKQSKPHGQDRLLFYQMNK